MGSSVAARRFTSCTQCCLGSLLRNNAACCCLCRVLQASGYVTLQTLLLLLLLSCLTADAGDRAIMRVPPRLAMAVSWLPLTDGSTGVSEALHLMAK
jgi:hypothetical protein